MKNKTTKYQGLIIPSEWDDKGRTVSVCMATAIEIIELLPSKISREQLLGLIHEQVEISGQDSTAFKKKAVKVDRVTIKQPDPGKE